MLCLTMLLVQTIAFGQSGSINKNFGNYGFRFTTLREPTSTQASTGNILINENADTYSIVDFGGNVVAYKRAGDGRPVIKYGDAGFSDHFLFGEKANCLLPDGSILFAGNIGIKPSFLEQPVTGNLVLGKLNKYGKWDQQLGPGGLKVLFQLKNPTQVIGLGILANGKILVVMREFIFQANKLILVTLLPSGDIDPSLPDNGRLVLPFGESQETIELASFQKQPDNKWILGVREHPTGDGTLQNYLVRLGQNGKPDAGFGIGGIQNISSYLPPEELVAVACKQGGGYILLTSIIADFSQLRYSRFTSTGVPDVANGGVSAQPISLPFSAVLRASQFDLSNRFSLLVAQEPDNWLNHFLVRLDATGKPDPSFNQVGYMALLQFPTTLYTGLALTPKNNLMVLGNSYESSYSFLVRKILEKGKPDPYYDRDGSATVSYPYSSFQWTTLLKVDDTRMIAGGFIRKGGKPYWLMESVNTQGKPVTGFGNNGSVLVPLPVTTGVVNMELTHDNHIFIYGSITGSPTSSDRVFLYKYLPDGSRDLSWANNGQKILTTGRSLNSIEVKSQADGKMLIAYGFFISTTGTNTADIQVQRLLSNGLTDNSFGYNGSRLIDVAQQADYIEHLRLQEDGKIILVNQTIVGANGQLSVIRLLANGRYDPAYQQGLKTILPTTVSFEINSALVKKDNKLLIAGNNHVSRFQSSAGLLQLNANGSVDRNFATNGIYLNPFSTEQATGIDVNLQADGKLLFTCRDFGNYMGENINVRLYANGRIDRSFAVNGVSQQSYSTSLEEVFATKLFPGQLVMAGFASTPVPEGMLMSITVDHSSAYKLAGITEPSAPGLLIYPNPARDLLTISWNGTASGLPKTLNLYDINGKLLQTWPAQSLKGIGLQQLQLDKHAAGNYLLHVIYADGSMKQEKIVIVR